METGKSRPPIRRWTSTNPERRLPLRDEHEEQERRKDHEMDEAVENVGPPGTEGEKARDSREHEQHGVLSIKPQHEALLQLICLCRPNRRNALRQR